MLMSEGKLVPAIREEGTFIKEGTKKKDQSSHQIIESVHGKRKRAIVSVEERAFYQ